jgi:trehalose 6-phosphate synthase
MPGARVDGMVVELEGRTTQVHVSPAAVDVGDIHMRLRSPAVGFWRDRVTKVACGRRVLARVDRADIWKNALRGFEAFELAMQDAPDTVPTVLFFAAITATRMWIPAYREYLQEVVAEVGAVNGRLRGLSEGRDVICLDVNYDSDRPDFERALGVFRSADVVLINPVRDGLNLVAKEAVVAGSPGPALVIARTTGVYDEFSELAIGVDALDVRDTARGIREALEMSRPALNRRADGMRRIAASRSPATWAAERLDACAARS